jgi:TonB-linked SusC/RagA family outer membrane protein
MKNHFQILLIFGMSFLPGILYAQQNISGLVTDMQDEPLTGVSVGDASSGNGTVTDMNGQFRLSVAANAKVRFSYLGYKPVEISVDSRTVYNVRMEEDVSELDEVVVVAYGTQRKKEITGAISVVDTRQIEKMTVPGIGQALQGLATGVHVTSSGTPGSGADIIIRGIGSFKDASPLYVIDGMILEISQREFNMNDVESIQVLKDASATALYGARGANGVILITTKRGGEGVTKISFNATLGVSQIAKRYDFMNSVDFLRLSRQAYENTDMLWSGEPEQGQKLVNTDWQNEFYKQGLTQDYNLSISGGNKNGKYMMSFDMYDEDGAVLGPWHKRLTIRSNSEAKKGIFTIGENLMIGRSETKKLQGNPFIDLIYMPPVIPVYANEEHTEYGTGTSSYPTYATNPIGLQETHDNREHNFRIIGSAYLQVEPIKDLIVKSNLGIEYFNWYDNHKTTGKVLRYVTNYAHETTLEEGNGDMQSWMWENTVSYKKKIGAHSFDALAGYSAQLSERRGNSVTGYDMMAEGFWVLNQASPDVPFDASGSRSAIGMTSILGRLNYDYADKYLVQLSARRDGTSLFGANYRYGVFPAVSLGWRISGERFMQSLNWLDDLKLRASYGLAGNQKALPAYQFATYIDPGDRVGIFGSPSTIAPGMIQTGFANSDLRWETRASTNIGVDFTLLNRHIYGTFEWFEANLNDLLITKNIPWSLGVDVNPWVNYAKIRNRGVEIQLGYRETKAEFKYDVSLNFSRTTNIATTLSDDSDYYRDGLGKSSNTVVNHSIGEFYVIRTDGIFQNWDEIYNYTHTNTYTTEILGHIITTEETKMIQPNAKPGDIRYKDVNNDGMISDLDREFVGSPFPDFEGGLSVSCSYKNFDLNLFLFGVYGNLIYNNNKRYLEATTEPHSMLKGFEPWHGEGTSNTVPRLLMVASDNGIQYSDRWIERGDYLRMKNLQIGYTLPDNLLKKTKVLEKFRIYAGVQNLFTLTGYSGLDPEVSGGNLFAKGYDDGSFPSPRMFNFGLQVTF